MFVLLLMSIVATRASAADETPGTSLRRSKSFAILASTYVALNAADIYTTATALRSGAGVEANPLVAPAAANPIAFTAVKAASTAATIVVARRLWTRHRAGAIALLVAANVGMAVVVAHNAHVTGAF